MCYWGNILNSGLNKVLGETGYINNGLYGRDAVRAVCFFIFLGFLSPVDNQFSF